MNSRGRVTSSLELHYLQLEQPTFDHHHRHIPEGRSFLLKQEIAAFHIHKPLRHQQSSICITNQNGMVAQLPSYSYDFEHPLTHSHRLSASFLPRRTPPPPSSRPLRPRLLVSTTTSAPALHKHRPHLRQRRQSSCSLHIPSRRALCSGARHRTA